MLWSSQNLSTLPPGGLSESWLHQPAPQQMQLDNKKKTESCKTLNWFPLFTFLPVGFTRIQRDKLLLRLTKRLAMENGFGNDFKPELIFRIPVTRSLCVRCVTCVHQKNGPFRSLPVMSSYLVGELFCQEYCNKRLPWARIQADNSIVFKSCFKKFYLRRNDGQRMSWRRRKESSKYERSTSTYLIFPRCVDVVMDGLLLPRQPKKRSHRGGGRGD